MQADTMKIVTDYWAQIALFLSIGFNAVVLLYITKKNAEIKKQEIVFDKVKENKIIKRL